MILLCCPVLDGIWVMDIHHWCTVSLPAFFVGHPHFTLQPVWIALHSRKKRSGRGSTLAIVSALLFSPFSGSGFGLFWLVVKSKDVLNHRDTGWFLQAPCAYDSVRWSRCASNRSALQLSSGDSPSFLGDGGWKMQYIDHAQCFEEMHNITISHKYRIKL